MTELQANVVLRDESPRTIAALVFPLQERTMSDTYETGSQTRKRSRVVSSTPLHDALHSYSLECVTAVDEGTTIKQLESSITELINDETVRVHDSKGRLPIHVACREGASFDTICALVRANPQSLLSAIQSVSSTSKGGKNWLPIHLVARYYTGRDAHAQQQILSAMIHAFPESIKISASINGNDLPLHLACRNFFTSPDVIELLANTYPKATALAAGSRKLLPIHIVSSKQYMECLGDEKQSSEEEIKPSASNTTAVKMMKILVRFNPSALKAFDDNGELPLFAAIRGQQPVSVISTLIKKVPESITFLNDKGKSALHIAASCTVPCTNTIKLLLRLDPTSTQMTDDDDKYAIEYLLRRNVSMPVETDILERFVAAYPASAAIIQKHTCKTTITTTATNDMDTTIETSCPASISPVFPVRQYASMGSVMSTSSTVVSETDVASVDNDSGNHVTLVSPATTKAKGSQHWSV